MGRGRCDLGLALGEEGGVLDVLAQAWVVDALPLAVALACLGDFWAEGDQGRGARGALAAHPRGVAVAQHAAVLHAWHSIVQVDQVAA